MPNRYVLDSSEVALIENTIAVYNAIIEQKATQYNLALVKLNSFFKNIVTGIKWDGADFTAQFVSGGFFSLDGYHPNQKGSALLANEFIRAINAKYKSTIPPVNCFDCDGIIFP
jgi:lysophospholipase L1-like esterase